jgi:hypothetical protein
LWIRDLPFKLENLRDVHRLVDPDAVMITCDEKSGYDHVRLAPNAQDYFGIEFGGYIMVYTVLPFGWKASPYIYQCIGMVVTSYLRHFGVVTVQYIDDRLAVANIRENLNSCDVICDGKRLAYIMVGYPPSPRM